MTHGWFKMFPTKYSFTNHIFNTCIKMILYWSLSDSNSHQVSRTLLSIRVVLNNVVVWKVSTRPPISKSPMPFYNPLVTVSNAPITIGIIVTFLFHFFFLIPSMVQELIFLFTFFQFYSVGSQDSKVDNFASSLFFFLFLIIIRSGLQTEIWWSVWMSKLHRNYAFYNLREVLGCAYTICWHG